MGLRYQRRVNLGAGWGFNLSLRGVSTSYRSNWGSFGSKGFSLRTGIPGLSYRSSWKSKDSGIISLLFITFFFVLRFFFGVVSFLFRTLFYFIIPALVQIILWFFYLIKDSIQKKEESIARETLNELFSIKESNSNFDRKLRQEEFSDNKTLGIPELGLTKMVVRRDIRFIDGKLIECSRKFSEFLNSTNKNPELKSYFQSANLSSYGHLLDLETIDDHIIYSDIYRLLTLLNLPDEIDGIFLQLVGQILDSSFDSSKDFGETKLFAEELLKKCKIYNEIYPSGAFLNSAIFSYFDQEYGTRLYSDISDSFNSFAYSLEGDNIERWNRQVRFIVMSPNEEYDREKIGNIF